MAGGLVLSRHIWAHADPLLWFAVTIAFDLRSKYPLVSFVVVDCYPGELNSEPGTSADLGVQAGAVLTAMTSSTCWWASAVTYRNELVTGPVEVK